MISIGDIAPDFELPNQDGQMVKLSDFRGQYVVIFAFPKANSLGCVVQACAFRDEAPQMHNANAVILGVSADPQEDLLTFKQRQNLSYDLLSDADHSMLTAYGAWGPSVFGLIKLPVAKRSVWIIDPEGRILDMEINAAPKESVRKATDALNAATT